MSSDPPKPVEKLRISDKVMETVRFGSSAARDSVAPAGSSAEPLSPELRRNFTMPPKERALECINVLLSLARSNLSTSQKRLHAARKQENEQDLAHWKWESIHWLRRCGKWSNHRRKVEAR
ncbi:MAG: hypothetical protein R3286_12520 [Gammaproteobacteria bacterium]|nr:hypothetical protein [Gammaproteobacteria bacterium]